MIGLVFTGKCKNCGCADLEINSIEMTDGILWTVMCRHERACDQMEDRTIDRLTDARRGESDETD